MLSDYKIENLGSKIKICINNNHKFTTDTLLLANFSSQKKVKNALELCCGSGAISLIWHRDNIACNIYSVDIQPDACELLKESVKINKIEKRLEVVNCDLKNIDKYIKGVRFDCIAVNPPYTTIGTGKTNDDKSKLTARHESECTIDDILRVSAKLLNFSGKFYICCRTHRLCEIMLTMKKYKIEPKQLQFVQQTKNKAPKLFLLQGIMGGKEFLNVMPTLIIQEDNGEYSEEMKRIYKDYFKENKRCLQN
ncbi:MAG: methyltransferase [Clostridia bacterium]|nr:methyltransferase [Clostridia bacterium]